MAIRRGGTSEALGRAAAFIDPYWLLGRSVEPSSAVVQALQGTLPGAIRLERVTWYLESDGGRHPAPTLPRVTLRVAARDDLDDGYELRSEERRVGKECWHVCRSRWSPYH